MSVLLCISFPVFAQDLGNASIDDVPLRFATVERPPFAMNIDTDPQGFSIDLMRDIASEMGQEVEFIPFNSFPEVFEAIETGDVDGAIANISITAAREKTMDFSQPIIASSLQVMLRQDKQANPIIDAVFSLDILYAILAAFGLLSVGGFMMWFFERNSQPYFDRPMLAAAFPSFWWALNLVVNGGFEERVPQSKPGRVFAVLLVISSLFIVSIFVATITASITVGAIKQGATSLADIEQHHIATTEGSTASAFLSAREISHVTTPDYAALIEGFENEEYGAVFFDQPILSWYARTQSSGEVRLLDRRYHPENYGIALAQGSPKREAINRALLTLREVGRYDQIHTKWFGLQ
ncbi:transporter substrate-binding domain-containing protein [Halocynthiibacter namhaensis]|uniref:transporter substrate-binding domain-containing protein n=1 Tax=Halocynthiibacter namhaensis TaxID=1290553 RepID=UPI0009DCE0F7|nr:transporter substrate-binding domain-containing protein [Halocynthiibacter namhaensis]